MIMKLKHYSNFARNLGRNPHENWDHKAICIVVKKALDVLFFRETRESWDSLRAATNQRPRAQSTPINLCNKLQQDFPWIEALVFLLVVLIIVHT